MKVQENVKARTVEQPTARSKRLTLQNLIAEGKEIWVRNQSGKISGKEAGNIVMQVGQGMAIDVVVIPPGADPVCLTDQVTPKLLAECMDLFKLVKAGALELLDPAQAEDYYQHNLSRKKIVEAKIEKLTKQTIDDDGVRPSPVKKVSQANIQVNPKVGDICLKAKHAAISEQEALEKLFEQESVLKMDDYNYILANGVYNGIKRWAQDRVNQLMQIDLQNVQNAEKDPVEASVEKHV